MDQHAPLNKDAWPDNGGRGAWFRCADSRGGTFANRHRDQRRATELIIKFNIMHDIVRALSTP